jgi:hypothetical protein
VSGAASAVAVDGWASGASVGVGEDSPEASICSTLLANVFMIASVTSPMAPRPNWATLPRMLRSVSIWTSVPPSSSVIVATMWASALPAPRCSRPLARIVSTRAASSASRIVNRPV